MDLSDAFLHLCRLSPVRYRATKCGHRTGRTGKVSAFGRSIVTRMSLKTKGRPDFCHSCLGKMAIQCAWCKKPIFIGDPVTLYTLDREKEKDVMTSSVQVFSLFPLQLVGCLRMGCAETGGDRAGFWVPGSNGKGQVERVPTAYEEILGGMSK